MASTLDNSVSISNRFSRIWWGKTFYRERWSKWRENWQKLLSNSPATGKTSPRKLLDDLTAKRCDPEIAVRLAFLVASHKPLAQSELSKDTKRQQSLRRRLKQAGQRLLDSARLLEEARADFPLRFIQPEHTNTLREIAQLCGHEDEIFA
jgi:hypothetical protein